MKSNTAYRTRYLTILLGLGSVFPAVSVAAITDISNGPLSSGIGATTIVKPNIAFVVDDSGSMARENMPNDGNSSKRCFGWYKYNTIAYNPNTTYKPPFKLDGAIYTDDIRRFPDADFSAALKDGYFANGGATYDGSDTSNATVDLNTAPLSNGTGTSNKYYYSTTTSTSTSCEDDNNYTRVASASDINAPNVAAGSDAAKINYANWYSYYRNRAGVMKAAAGEAFRNLDESKYRIGLFHLNSTDSGAKYTTKNSDLKIADFNGSASGTQRYAWYEKLYGARISMTTTGSTAYTPLRGALSRMGRMFAGKIDGWDPAQYSCQQNFTILSTDGQWNTNSEQNAYGPKQINGSDDIGDQDKALVSAVSATSVKIINTAAFNSNTCYQVNNLTVVTDTAPDPDTVVELLSVTPLLPTCANGGSTAAIEARADNFGTALASSINANTATGFKALYDANTNKITLTAPASLGNFAAVPSLIVKKVSDNTTYTGFALSAFSGGSGAADGADVPYKDIYGVANTLGDIAYYYYNTDLRTLALGNCTNTIGGTAYSSLCADNVLGSGKDSNSKQHMTTFTVGLGVNGNILYESNYETAKDISGVTQYFDIANNTAFWPNPTTDTTKIDDLWHAAVNGRGNYYNASNAETLKTGLQAALAGVQARNGSSAAAATSNLEPVAGDNYVYVALYRTQNWDGDLKAFEIDPETGALSGTPLWSAQSKLDAQVATAVSGDGRTIKYFNSGETDKLKDFTLTNLTADSLHSFFTEICTDADKLAQQCSGLTADQKAVANSGESLVNYLRGQGTYENEPANATDTNKLYRGREHVLGDTINAVPVYMKKPPFSYDKFDTSYATFKTNNANRAATVFVAANDGMLHAINATSDSTLTADYENRGKERWAYVPRAVMSNMWKLADSNYADNHRYFVDGSPTVADICVNLENNNNQMCASAGDWKTILVGGLNKGGCSYYALDVTDPANPKGMWEFTNDNLGYSYGNPVVGKDKSGRWVVIFTSGYNNVSGNGCGNTGDGNGHVFVVNAATGVLIEDIVTYTSGVTAAGTTEIPSGLAKLNAWINNADLPIIDRLYGGDLLGNLWRIDFDNNYGTAGKEAMLLAQLQEDGNPQPITVKPELAVVQAGGTQHSVVMVGTGKYLGTNDIDDLSQQSVYAVKDSLTTTGISDVRGNTMVSRTLTQTTGTTGSLLGRTIRTISGETINWATHEGWYMDLNPDATSPGERVNVDMSLQFNILTVAANVPANNACEVGGSAYLYFLDIDTGKNLTTAINNMAGVRLSSNALVAGIKTLRLTSGKTVTVITDTAGGVGSEANPSASGGGAGVTRRTTWREIAN